MIKCVRGLLQLSCIVDAVVCSCLSWDPSMSTFAVLNLPKLLFSFAVAAWRVCILQTCTLHLRERMAGSGLLWLALTSCILTLASTSQHSEYSVHLGSQMHSES